AAPEGDAGEPDRGSPVRGLDGMGLGEGRVGTIRICELEGERAELEPGLDERRVLGGGLLGAGPRELEVARDAEGAGANEAMLGRTALLLEPIESREDRVGLAGREPEAHPLGQRL